MFILMNSFLYESSLFFVFLFLNCIQEISPLLSMEAMAFVTEDRKAAQESTFPNTYTFDLFGGVDVSVVGCAFVSFCCCFFLIFSSSKDTKRFLHGSHAVAKSVNDTFETCEVSKCKQQKHFTVLMLVITFVSI